MSRYARQIAQAVRMIKKFGQPVQWQKQAITKNVLQPWKATPATPETFNDIPVLFLKPSGGLSNALYHLIKGTDAPSGAPRGLMAVQAFTPDLTDRVLRNGSILVIKTIDVVAPNGEPILYDIEFS